MKRPLYIIFGITLSCYLFCITMHLLFHHVLVLSSSPHKNNLRLDVDSLTNAEIIASGYDNEKPCPLELTNDISNTNLFTPAEKKLIESIPSKYGNVTLASGPKGSVPLHLGWYLSIWNELLQHEGDVPFQFTNSDLRDDVTLGGGVAIHHVRNTAGDGYELHYWQEQSIPCFQLFQYKHGVFNGLRIEIHGDHCLWWMRFKNGMAVDQWLYWSPDNSKLQIWVKFNKPYDYLKYSNTGFGS
jgi:hypothetical protein